MLISRKLPVEHFKDSIVESPVDPKRVSLRVTLDVVKKQRSVKK